MAEYKPKLKDVALAAQTAGRQAEHAIDGVRELREVVAKLEKDITQLRLEMFADKEIERLIVENNFNTIKPDSSICIDLATFAKNKCPHCGSHNLRFTFVPDAFSDSTVNCRDCHNSWKFKECAEDIYSPYEVANKLRSEHRTLFEENKDLKYEIEKLRKQAAIDASYMVTVEDLMARIKSRDERIIELKKDIDAYIYERNDLYLSNLELNEQCAKMADEIDRLKKEIAAYEDEKYGMKLMKKALNIYQNITDLDVTLTRNTAYVRLTDSDDAGRAMVKGDELDALCDAYLKYYDAFRKEKKDAKNK